VTGNHGKGEGAGREKTRGKGLALLGYLWGKEGDKRRKESVKTSTRGQRGKKCENVASMRYLAQQRGEGKEKFRRGGPREKTTELSPPPHS